MSRYNDGTTAWPENPLIISPKLRGRRIHRGPAAVYMGSLRLPGAWVLRVPSAIKTANKVSVEMIPIKEVIDRKRRGTKVVGKMLESHSQVSACAATL